MMNLVVDDTHPESEGVTTLGFVHADGGALPWTPRMPSTMLTPGPQPTSGLLLCC